MSHIFYLFRFIVLENNELNESGIADNSSNKSMRNLDESSPSSSQQVHQGQFRAKMRKRVAVEL